MALVYRGKASTPGCPEAAAALLTSSEVGLDVRFVGPKEKTALSPDALAEACLYVQPGGPSLRKAYRRLGKHGGAIAEFVSGGGRYLGFCLGGYLAGHTPGFALLPGDTERYIDTPASGVTGTEDTVVEVSWAGARRPVFFQDGPSFVLQPGHGAEILATYPNGRPAAVLSRYGRGAVGVVGPHPEADLSWFHDAGLPPPPRLALDLGVHLVRRLLEP